MKLPRQIPAFELLQLKPKAHEYCVCIFVLNEGERFRNQLKKMKAIGLDGQADIIVADGGSTDGSVEDEMFLRENGVSARLTKTGPGKLSAQMRMAFDYALERGYEGVITVDGNDKDDTAAVPLFIAKLKEGYDHVQGSRYIAGGRAVNTPPARHWGVKLLHAPLISLASRRWHTDTTNGFRAYSRRFLTDPRVQPFRDVFNRYELHYYLTIRASRLGFRTTEVPVTRSYPPPSAGTKTPSKITGWRGNWQVLKALIAACLGRFNP